MVENTLLNKSGDRPAGKRRRRGHSTKQQNNTNNNNKERWRQKELLHWISQLPWLLPLSIFLFLGRALDFFRL